MSDEGASSETDKPVNELEEMINSITKILKDDLPYRSFAQAAFVSRDKTFDVDITRHGQSRVVIVIDGNPDVVVKESE